MNKYVYVKDSEGFVIKKSQDQVLPDETIISKQEYEEISGLKYYKETFGRGGARPGAGRKKQFISKKRETFDLEESDVISLKEYAKKHKISKNKALQEAINNLIRNEA
ncbi:MAG: hypothetical protein PHC34_06105 [Candidatus Gastranaerophilales bacterium]|nr:hypothetical protein [Candidatus Gastranaerophilales bacterium]